MGVNVGTMGPDDIVALLNGAGTFENVQAAIEALKLNANQFLSGIGYRITGGAGAAAAAAEVGIQGMLDFFSKQTLKATATEVKTAAVGLAKKGAESVGTLLLGVDVGVIGAAVAPFGGVALGAGLYKSNPELWTKISQTLVPWGWKDTVKMPVWAQYVEDAGKWVCSIPKKLVDSILSMFQKEGIGPATGTETVINTTGKYEGITSLLVTDHTEYHNTWASSNISYVAINAKIYCCRVENRFYITAYSLDKNAILEERVNGQLSGSSQLAPIYYEDKIYYGSGYNYDTTFPDGNWLFPAISDMPVASEWSFEKIGYVALFGTIQGGGGTYPEGTSAYAGTKPELTLGPDVYFDPDTLEPTYDINIPGLEELNEYKPAPWVQYPEDAFTPSDIPSAPTGVLDIPDFSVPWENVKPWVIPTDIPGEDFVGEAVKEGEWADFATPDPPSLIPPAIPPAVPFGQIEVPNVPSTPLPFSSTAGFVTVYHPTAQQLYDFQSWLWVTYAEADKEKIWNNPFDGVISLAELYCTPTDTGTRNIHSGFLDSGINSAVISRYTEINCGTLGIPEYWGNYLDYSPYTRAYIYLPFIGIQELSADDIVGHAVNVTYRIDEYNGSCIAMITVAKSTEVNGETKSYQNVMYQFTGNCSVELPFAGGSQAQIKAAFMTADAYQRAANFSALGQAIGGLASVFSTNPLGGLVGGATGAMSTYFYGEAQHTANILSGKAAVSHSGQFGSSQGALGIKKPFITIVRPKQIQVVNYNELYGFPAHKQVVVGDCTGFLRCREVHVISDRATDEEKSIIESIMKSGVYVTE